MRIDRLQIANFKGFTDRSFDFPQSIDASPGSNGSVHVLIGENGSGKTSALDALAVALGIWHVGVGGYGWRNIGKSEVRVAVSDSNRRPTFIEQLPTRIEATGRITNQPVKWSREVLKMGGRTLNRNAGAAVTMVRDLVSRARKQEHGLILPLLAYYGSGRLWHDSSTPKAWSAESDRSNLSRLWTYKGCMNAKCSALDLNQWLLEHDWESYQEGKDVAGYALVKGAILQCLPKARQLRFSPTRKEGVMVIEGQSEQPFSNLSDGQRNIMAMVGDLAVKAVKLNYEALGDGALSTTPGVVLIDEVDLHLHPSWQQVVLENLRTIFPNLQFIATTHSPFIVQTLRAGELLVLDGQSVPKTDNLGLETISKGLMKVDRPDVGPKYREMVGAAKQYLVTLDEAALAPEEKLAEFEKLLAAQIEPYASDPAFQAFLELKHEAKLGRRKKTPHGGESLGADS